MLSVTTTKRGREMADNPTKTIWHWVAPVIVSMLITGGTVLLAAGGLEARLAHVEKITEKLGTKLDDKLERLATKEDLREFREEIREDMKDGRKK